MPVVSSGAHLVNGGLAAPQLSHAPLAAGLIEPQLHSHAPHFRQWEERVLLWPQTQSHWAGAGVLTGALLDTPVSAPERSSLFVPQLSQMLREAEFTAPQLQRHGAAAAGAALRRGFCVGFCGG